MSKRSRVKIEIAGQSKTLIDKHTIVARRYFTWGTQGPVWVPRYFSHSHLTLQARYPRIVLNRRLYEGGDRQTPFCVYKGNEPVLQDTLPFISSAHQHSILLYFNPKPHTSTPKWSPTHYSRSSSLQARSLQASTAVQSPPTSRLSTTKSRYIHCPRSTSLVAYSNY